MLIDPPTIATAILLLIAGHYDWKDRRLPGPGGWPIPLLILAIGAANTLMLNPAPAYIFLLVNILLAIAAILFYGIGVMAAGDTKILLALALGFPFSPNTFIMYLTSLIPGAYMIIRKVRPIPMITCLAIGYAVTVIIQIYL